MMSIIQEVRFIIQLPCAVMLCHHSNSKWRQRCCEKFQNLHFF